jgi:hypothetical protein
MVRIFLAITMIMSFAADAFADRVKTTVPKNRKTLVGTYANYAEGTCRAGAIPQMKVTRKPKHGKVSFRQVSGKLGKNAGPCAGETVKGVAVYYTPKSGYRGGRQVLDWIHRIPVRRLAPHQEHFRHLHHHGEIELLFCWSDRD